MTYNITLTFTVHDLDTDDDAQEFAINLANHVADTFNDDGSIDPYVDVVKIDRKRG